MRLEHPSTVDIGTVRTPAIREKIFSFSPFDDGVIFGDVAPGQHDIISVDATDAHDILVKLHSLLSPALFRNDHDKHDELLIGPNRTDFSVQSDIMTERKGSCSPFLQTN